jgi:hypothetical protein
MAVMVTMTVALPPPPGAPLLSTVRFASVFGGIVPLVRRVIGAAIPSVRVTVAAIGHTSSKVATSPRSRSISR